MDKIKEFANDISKRIAGMVSIAIAIVWIFALYPNWPKFIDFTLVTMFGLLTYQAVYTLYYGYVAKPIVVKPIITTAVFINKPTDPDVSLATEEEIEEAFNMEEMGKPMVDLVMLMPDDQWIRKTNWRGLSDYLNTTQMPEFTRRALAAWVPIRFYNKTSAGFSFAEIMVEMGAAVEIDGIFEWTTAGKLILSEIAEQTDPPTPLNEIGEPGGGIALPLDSVTSVTSVTNNMVTLPSGAREVEYAE